MFLFGIAFVFVLSETVRESRVERATFASFKPRLWLQEIVVESSNDTRLHRPVGSRLTCYVVVLFADSLSLLLCIRRTLAFDAKRKLLSK